MFQTKSATSSTPFQSSSTTVFQPTTTSNIFQSQQSTTPNTGNIFQPQQSTPATTSMFQTQQPAQQSGFSPTSSTMTSNLFQSQQPAQQSGFSQNSSTTTQNPQQPAQQSGFSQISSTTTPNPFQPQQHPPTPSMYQAPPPHATPHVSSTFTQQELDLYLSTCSVNATTPDDTELAERKKELLMWTPNVHRDIYNILLNPYILNTRYKGDQDAGAVLIAKEMNCFAFIDKVFLKGLTLSAEWTILSDDLILNAIDHMGDLTANALAVLKAFEKYLETKVKKWTPVDVVNLSVEFLFCFGRELSPKFDINHRMRTRQCTPEEVSLLQSLPYSQFVSSDIVKRYQKW